MSFSENWNLANSFTLEQAAHLWCEKEPASVPFLGTINGGIDPDIAAIFSALHNEAQNGLLPTVGGLPNIGDYSRSVVSRSSLEGFARQRKHFPKFLFDTLVEPPIESPTVKPKGGRRPTHDWNGFIGEIVRIADGIDGLPKTDAGKVDRAHLIATMAQWFVDRTGDQPSQSQLYDKLKPIADHLDQTSG